MRHLVRLALLLALCGIVFPIADVRAAPRRKATAKASGSGVEPNARAHIFGLPGLEDDIERMTVLTKPPDNKIVVQADRKTGQLAMAAPAKAILITEDALIGAYKEEFSRPAIPLASGENFEKAHTTQRPSDYEIDEMLLWNVRPKQYEGALLLTTKPHVGSVLPYLTAAKAVSSNTNYYVDKISEAQKASRALSAGSAIQHDFKAAQAPTIAAWDLDAVQAQLVTKISGTRGRKAILPSASAPRLLGPPTRAISGRRLLVNQNELRGSDVKRLIDSSNLPKEGECFGTVLQAPAAKQK